MRFSRIIAVFLMLEEFIVAVHENWEIICENMHLQNKTALIKVDVNNDQNE